MADLVRDQPRQRERGGGGGGGGVADMERALGLRDDEVVDEATVAAEGLGAHAGGAGEHVVGRELRDVAGAVRDERLAADGVAQLAQPGPPPAAGHAVGAGPGEGLAQVGGGEAAQVVGVARAGQQRGRADQHLVVGAAGEVDAEERQRGVGHGVDERAHEVAALGPQAQPGAAEGDDARVGVAARPRPRAGPTSRRRRTPRSAPGSRPARGGCGCRLALHVGAVDRTARDHLAAGRLDVARERLRDRLEVDDGGGGGVQRVDAAGVRLDLGDLLGAQAPQARHAVGAAAALELVEPRDLARVERHDQLAVLARGDARAPRSTRAAPARPRCTGAPSASRARSRSRRARRRSCGRSGGSR